MLEFVSYDGSFPNLCRGLLVVRIEGNLYAFCPYLKREILESSSFWKYDSLEVVALREAIMNDHNIVKIYGFSLISGGSIIWESGEPKISRGKWRIDVKDLYKDDGSKFVLSNQQKEELESVINHNIEYGCCGGCI
jgi:hypothetical protein